MKNLKLFVGIAIVALIATNVIQCNRNNKASQMLEMYNTINDKLRTFESDYGDRTSAIRSFSATSASMFLKLEVQDTLIRELQTLVKRNKNTTAAIVHTTTTTIRDTGHTIVVYDTITKEIRWPVGGYISNDWTWGRVSVYPEHSVWDITFKDTSAYSLNTIKHGFLGLGRETYEITAINKNPHVKTTGLRSFNMTERKRLWHVGIQAGWGINQEGKLGWHLGLGVQRSLISF